MIEMKGEELLLLDLGGLATLLWKTQMWSQDNPWEPFPSPD